MVDVIGIYVIVDIKRLKKLWEFLLENGNCKLLVQSTMYWLLNRNLTVLPEMSCQVRYSPDPLASREQKVAVTTPYLVFTTNQVSC